jgi:hypothetical protein
VTAVGAKTALAEVKRPRRNLWRICARAVSAVKIKAVEGEAEERRRWGRGGSEREVEPYMKRRGTMSFGTRG